MNTTTTETTNCNAAQFRFVQQNIIIRYKSYRLHFSRVDSQMTEIISGSIKNAAYRKLQG